MNLKGIEIVCYSELVSESAPKNQGILKQVQHDDSRVLVKTMAGENWHDFVLHTLEN